MLQLTKSIIKSVITTNVNIDTYATQHYSQKCITHEGNDILDGNEENGEESRKTSCGEAWGDDVEYEGVEINAS